MVEGRPEDGGKEGGQQDVATEQEGVEKESVDQDSLGAGEVIMEETAHAGLQGEPHGRTIHEGVSRQTGAVQRG